MAAKPKLAFRAGASVRFLDGSGETQHGVIDHIEPGFFAGIVRYAVMFTTSDGPCIVLREAHELWSET